MLMIVCLGWGSLIWNPGALEIEGNWHDSGPNLSIEYLRHSKDGRLTLVIDENGKKSRVLWAQMLQKDLELAKENLRIREGRIDKNYIGVWTKGDESPNAIADLDIWAKSIGCTAIIWTNLPPKFKGEVNRRPSLTEAILYLDGLEGEPRALAEEYIRKTPAQIKTSYRAKFEEHFGWR